VYNIHIAFDTINDTLIDVCWCMYAYWM